MNSFMISSLLLVLLIGYTSAQCSLNTTTTTTQNPSNAGTAPAPGTWSPWAENGCTDTCGSCGVTIMFRICLVAGSCTGPTIMNSTTPCNTKGCPYPRSSCCPGYTLGVTRGTIQCLPTAV